MKNLKTYESFSKENPFQEIKQDLPEMVEYARSLADHIIDYKESPENPLFYDKSSKKLANKINEVIDFFRLSKIQELIDEWQDGSDPQTLEYTLEKYHDTILVMYEDIKKINRIELHSNPDEVVDILSYDFTEDGPFIMNMYICSMTFVDPNAIMGNGKIGTSMWYGQYQEKVSFNQLPSYFLVYEVPNDVSDAEIKDYITSYDIFSSFDLSVKDIDIYQLRDSNRRYVSFMLIENLD